jgi:hypothetical protein
MLNIRLCCHGPVYLSSPFLPDFKSFKKWARIFNHIMSKQFKRARDAVIEVHDDEDEFRGSISSSSNRFQSMPQLPNKSLRTSDQLDEANLQIFGHGAFRKGQRAVIEDTLAGRDCFVIMVQGKYILLVLFLFVLNTLVIPCILVSQI